MGKSELGGDQYDPSTIENMSKEDIAKAMVEENKKLVEKDTPNADTPPAQKEEVKADPTQQIKSEEKTQEVLDAEAKAKENGEEAKEGEEAEKTPEEKKEDDFQKDTENMSPKAAVSFKKLLSEKNEAIRERDEEIQKLKDVNADPERKALQAEVDTQVSKLLVDKPSAKQFEDEISKICIEKDVTADQAFRMVNPAAYVDPASQHDADKGKYSGAGRSPGGNGINENTDLMKMPMADLKKAANAEFYGQ